MKGEINNVFVISTARRKHK